MAGICLSMILLSGCGLNYQWPTETPTVTVVKAKTEKIRPRTEYIGQLVVYKQVELRARVSGFLEKRNFKSGQFVKKGQTVYQIEKAQYQIAVEAAEANYEEANDILENATIEFDRVKKLTPSGAVSKKEYDYTRSQYKQAKAKNLACKAALEQAKLNLSYTDIKAPFDGYIALTSVDEGALIGPESPPLTTLTVFRPIYAEFNVTEAEAITGAQEFEKSNKNWTKAYGTELLPNIDVKLILTNGTEYNHTGVVDYVSYTVDPLTDTVLLRAVFENPDAILMPGGFVTVILEHKNEIEAVIIPQEAVQQNQGGKYVLTVSKDNTIQMQYVTLGITHNKGFVVTSGLKAGEAVVIKGLQMVHEGSKVKVKPDVTVSSKLKADNKNKEVKKVEKTKEGKNKAKEGKSK